MSDDNAMTGEELGATLLTSIRQMKAGQGTVVYPPALAARQRTGLSQARFAELLGVSVRHLTGMRTRAAAA